MSVVQGVATYYQLAGIKALLAISSYRLFGRPKEISVRAHDIKNPVYLRIRTSDVSVYEDILIGKEYDFCLPFVPRNIVDCGANIGMASIFFANKYPEARIIALEPEASNFEILSRNAAGYPNIFPIQAALWKEECELDLYGSSNFAFRVREGKGIRAISMTNLMREADMETIDLLKVDIEGAEKAVFESAEWMGRVRALMIEIHDHIEPGCRQAVESATRGWSSIAKGELTVFIANGIIESTDGSLL